MTSHYLVIALLVIILVFVGIWALKNLIWVIIGIIIGAVGHATYVRLRVVLGET